MMIPCRIFAGRTSGRDTDSPVVNERFLVGDRGLIYVLDELALKSQHRHDDGYQNLDTLVERRRIEVVRGGGSTFEDLRLLDLAFQDSQGYGVAEFLDKFVKPVFLQEGCAVATSLPTNPVEWIEVSKKYRVWVNVQDGAKTITTPAVGQLVYAGDRKNLQFDLRD